MNFSLRTTRRLAAVALMAVLTPVACDKDSSEPTEVATEDLTIAVNANTVEAINDVEFNLD